MRQPLAISALLVAIATAPAHAQPSAIADIVAQARQVSFSEDSNGYGRTLIDGLMPGRVARWERAGTRTRLAVAQTALAGNGQPEFAVRIENPEMCDKDGCLTFVFMLVERAWQPVFQAKVTDLAVGPIDSSSRMALLVTQPATVWAWNGRRYDVAQ